MRLRIVLFTVSFLKASLFAVWALNFCPAARADVASERRPLAIFTLGPSAEYALNGEWRFGGEVGLSQYVGAWGYGACVGALSSGRSFAELESALVLGTKHNLILGLNPGVVVDVTGDKPHWGGQATLWGNYAYSRRRTWPLASPVIGFLRVQAVNSFGITLSLGISLRIPLPAS